MTAAVESNINSKKTINHIDDFKSGGTLHYTLNNFGKLNTVNDTFFSPPVMIRGLSWEIRVSRIYELDLLGFYLWCKPVDFDSNSWSCQADATFKIKSQKQDVKDIEDKLSNLFDHDDKGWTCGLCVSMKSILSPIDGYIKSNALIFEINVIADEPKGIIFRKESMLSDTDLHQPDLFSLEDILTNYLIFPEHLKEFQLNETSRKSLNQRLFEAVLNDDNRDMAVMEEIDPDQIILKSNDGSLFKCSRKILAMQSSFWKNAFSNVSNKCDVEVLEEFNEATLTEVLRFVYTEKFYEEKLAFCATSCLKASEKYGLALLKEYCSFILRRNLNAENAVSHLLLAEYCKDEALMNFAIKFISHNLSYVRRSENWPKILTASFQSIDSIFGLVAIKVDEVVKLK